MHKSRPRHFGFGQTSTIESRWIMYSEERWVLVWVYIFSKYLFIERNRQLWTRLNRGKGVDIDPLFLSPMRPFVLINTIRCRRFYKSAETPLQYDRLTIAYVQSTSVFKHEKLRVSKRRLPWGSWPWNSQYPPPCGTRPRQPPPDLPSARTAAVLVHWRSQEPAWR